MTEELNNTEVVEEVETVDAPEETQPKEETFTKAQLEEIVKQRVAREKKAAEKAVEEAKKLAKMNEDEKAKYELEQLQNELAELKRKDARNGLAKEATKMLSEHEIPVDEEVFEVVVKETAEETKAKVEWFAGLVDRLAEQKSRKALSGNTPKANVVNGKVLSKEGILAIKDSTERIRAIQENPHLFN